MEEDFVDECLSVETDEDYEFDASRYYDLSRAENDSEIEDVERWFEVSGDYPHSPFVVKLNLEKIEDSKRNAKESKTKPKSWSFMEPTASHLAKLPTPQGSNYLCARFQRTTGRLAGYDNLATKRQKLDIGYLKKGSRLKHHSFLQHKPSNKVTVPREPQLETQVRRRSNEKQTQLGCNFKASRKILHSRPLHQHRKRKPQSPEFQENKVSAGDKVSENKLIGQFNELSLGSNRETQNASRHSSAKGLSKDGSDPFQPEFCGRHSKPNQCGHMRVHKASMTRSLDIR